MQQEFVLSRYLYPGIGDLSSLRVSQAAKDFAETWLAEQGAEIYNSRSGQAALPVNGQWVDQPVQSILFQDTTPDLSLIGDLEENELANLKYYRHNDDLELTRPAFDQLQKVKALNSSDYISNLPMRAAMAQADFDRFRTQRAAKDQALKNSPNYDDIGSQAYNRLLDLAKKENTEIHLLSPEHFGNAYEQIAKNRLTPDELERMHGFAKQDMWGTTPAIYLQEKPHNDKLKYAGTLAHELGHALSTAKHSIAGTYDEEGLTNRPPGRVHEIHADPIGHGLMRHVLPSDNHEKSYMDTISFLTNSVPKFYVGTYGPDSNLVDYLSRFDYQNQIRDSIRYAGQLLL